MKSILRILLTEFSKTIFTPSFANTLLSTVFLSIHQILEFQNLLRFVNQPWLALLSLNEIKLFHDNNKQVHSLTRCLFR